MDDQDFLDYCTFWLHPVNDAQFVRVDTACRKKSRPAESYQKRQHDIATYNEIASDVWAYQ